MRVLFIGNSHTFFHDMPHTFAEICRRNGVQTEVTMLAHGGMGWDYHVKQPEVRFNIRFGQYDAVVLQHTAHPMGDLTVMAQAGKELIDWVWQAGARPVLYMTWTAKRDGAQAQPEMSAPYRALAQQTGSALAPVGEIWWRFAKLAPQEELYASDGEHASQLGSLLAAYVIAAAVLQKNVGELAADQPLDRLIAQAAGE